MPKSFAVSNINRIFAVEFLPMKRWTRKPMRSRKPLLARKKHLCCDGVSDTTINSDRCT